jgi:hypothetical protein
MLTYVNGIGQGRIAHLFRRQPQCFAQYLIGNLCLIGHFLRDRVNNKAGSSCVVTLPTASDNVGRELHFQNYQAQTLVSASSNVIPLAGGAAGTAILGAVAGANATLVSDGTNWVLTQ